MALSSLSKLQLLRSFLLLLIVLDVGVNTILFLQIGSGKNIEDTITDQVRPNVITLFIPQYPLDMTTVYIVALVKLHMVNLVN